MRKKEREREREREGEGEKGERDINSMDVQDGLTREESDSSTYT